MIKDGIKVHLPEGMKEEEVVSYQPEVTTAGDKEFTSNSLRFATPQEAERSAFWLFGRWMAVVNYRVGGSRDPVNYENTDDIFDRPINSLAQEASGSSE